MAMDDSVQDIDVLVIGAGINGAGVFRDLCEQGLRCVILDKGDFGSGTSAAPSRLIHGGLKYLETGEFGLVAESTYERNLLLRNAAHMVTPLPTVIPIHSWTKGIWAALRTLARSKTAPRARGAILVKIGLLLYDLFGAKARVMPRHKMLSRARALARIPALSPDIVAAGTYYDAAIAAPERLVLELVQDGLAASPASAAFNWAGFDRSEAGVIEVTGAKGEVCHIRPRVVINAAGPWIDTVNARLGLETQLIGGTKGSHILLDHPELLAQLDGQMIYFESDDGRILLVFPFLGKALVGSTDIPADDPDAAICEETETAYFIDSLRKLLPGLHFDKSQIVFSYAGIRPLPNSQGVAPGLISRDHSAPFAPAQADRPFPILSLVGGKWTTFRAFSAQVCDRVLDHLGAARRTTTEALPIGGGRDLPLDATARAAWCADLARRSGADVDRVTTLLDRYGTTARAIAAEEGPAPRFIDGTRHSEQEIAWIVRHERVCRIEDVLLRRTSLAITGQVTPAVFDRVAEITAAELKWPEERLAQERAASRSLLVAKHGLRL